MQAPLYTQSAPNTARGLMACIWHGLLQAYASNDPSVGTRIKDDFTKPVSHTDSDGAGEVMSGTEWFGQEAAVNGSPSVAIISQASVDGVWGFDVGSTTAIAGNHEGGEWHRGVTATGLGCVNLPTHGTDPRGPVVFQLRLDLADAPVGFYGLTEPIVDFLSATSTLPTASDYIGFYTVDAGATLKFVCANDNNGGTAVTGEFTIPDELETGFNNIGFRVNKNGDLEIGVNDNWYGPAVHGIGRTALPIETLTPKIAVTRGTTSEVTITVPVDSLDCFVAAG